MTILTDALPLLELESQVTMDTSVDLSTSLSMLLGFQYRTDICPSSFLAPT